MGVLCQFGLFLLAVAANAQQPKLTPQDVLLARIRNVAAANLQRLPNYTCLETIERSQRRNSNRRFQLIDLVRLEVALVNNRELFAWPGSEKFDERDLTDMVSGGAIGTGSFAIHARSVFLSGTPTFRWFGETTREGHRVQRFDYDVPMAFSGYRLRVKPFEGIAGYRGSFWVDADNLDLLWMEVRTTDIPPTVPITSAYEMLGYRRMKIGEKDFLLPLESEMILIDAGGNESRNRIRFSNCREYAIESTIRFDDAPDSSAVLKVAVTRVELPAGLELDLRLDNNLEAGTIAVGDPVRAVAARDARLKGQLIVPKGAVATGRIVRMQRHEDQRAVVEWELGIELTRIEFNGKFAQLRARLDPSTQAIGSGLQRTGNVTRYTMVRERPPDNPRIGILYVKGEHGKLAPGFHTYWRTESPDQEDKK